MRYCLPGYLNIFVETYQIQTTILSWISTNKAMTHTEVWDAIQEDPGLDATVKGLSVENVKVIMDWMRSNGMIGNAETQEITYTLPE